VSDPFSALPDGRLDQLIGQTPICWIVPHAAPDAAILMPVVLERETRPVSLLGHLPRRAPATDVLMLDPAVSFLFLGPNAYVSPAMAGRRDWAPTWNFASARLTGAVTLDDALTRPSLEAVVAHMEGKAGWRIEELGPRADDLIAQIIGFRAVACDASLRLKLGQDENPEDFASIAKALEGTDLGEWMTRYGRGH
jgi:transcriptional regulator